MEGQLITKTYFLSRLFIKISDEQIRQVWQMSVKECLSAFSLSKQGAGVTKVLRLLTFILLWVYVSIHTFYTRLVLEESGLMFISL